MINTLYSKYLFPLTALFLLTFVIPNSYAQEPRKTFPATALIFKQTPKNIQTNAKAGKFSTIKVLNKVFKFGEFFKIVTNTIDGKRALVTLAVVVDEAPTQSKTKEKLRILKQQIEQVLHGIPNKNIKGQAELNGAYITGIAPIMYQPHEIINNKKMSKNDIYLFINEQVFIYSETDFKTSKAKALDGLMQAYKGGYHLETEQEYQKRIAAKKAAIRKLEQDIKEIDETIKVIDKAR